MSVAKKMIRVWTKTNMFDPATIRKSTTISLKNRVRLLFRRTKFSTDSSKDGTALTRYKQMDGVIYVLDVQYWPPPVKEGK